MVHFLHAGGKFHLGTAVHDMHLGAKPQRSTRRIHRHIAATHDADLLSGVDRRKIILTERLHQVIAGKELIGGKHPVQVLAGNAHETGQARPAADKYGLVAFVIHQLVDGDGPADNDIRLNGYAQTLHLFQFLGEHLLLRQTEFRDSILQHAARLVQRFKNGNAVAPLRKVARTGKTGRTGTYDSHLMPVGGRSDGTGTAVGMAPVRNEAFQFSDSHRFPLDSEDTASLALAFLRADTSADGGERRIFGNHAGRTAEISRQYLPDKFGDFDIDGAGAHAARVLAVQAAGRFPLRFFHIISVTNFLEVGCTHFGVLFPDRDPGYFVCHYFPLPILQTCFSFASASSALYWP